MIVPHFTKPSNGDLSYPLHFLLLYYVVIELFILLSSAAAAFLAAASGHRTSNTDSSFFLFSDYICNCRTNYSNYDKTYDNIDHLLTSLSVFFIKYTITAAIAATTISPGTKPAPTVPSVIRVPIWYTRNAAT